MREFVGLPLFGMGLPLFLVELLLFAKWESWTPVFEILVRALALDSTKVEVEKGRELGITLVPMCDTSSEAVKCLSTHNIIVQMVFQSIIVEKMSSN